jgi:hypothetical protein
MPGTKGKSGGARPGAGPPRTKATVRIGDSFAAVLHYPNGQCEILSIATITVVKPSLIVITLADGGSIRLAR